MTRYRWTQPCCEECWDERSRIGGDPGREGVVLTHGVELETCVYCGTPTFSGLYVRIDPAEAPYPSLTK